jgi:multimeric flavodoxin WrbA
MKILAVNASPKMDKGNTALLLTPFLEGAADAGADIEILYTQKLHINPCRGDVACWIKTPGKCNQKDDMPQVLEKLRAADVWVLATPVYVDGMTGPLKTLLDRLIPLGQPFIELQDGHCRHPGRDNVTSGPLVLVSNCGFWELDNFDPLLIHVRAICKNLGRHFAGALLRPHGHVLQFMKDNHMPVNDIFDAARQAGRHIITDQKINPDTLSTISRPLVPRETFIQPANQAFSRALNTL